MKQSKQISSELDIESIQSKYTTLYSVLFPWIMSLFYLLLAYLIYRPPFGKDHSQSSPIERIFGSLLIFGWAGLYAYKGYAAFLYYKRFKKKQKLLKQ